MNRLRGRVMRLERLIAERSAGGDVAGTLEAARRGGTAREPRQTLEELRQEMTLGGWRQRLAEARARLWYWDEHVAGAV